MERIPDPVRAGVRSDPHRHAIEVGPTCAFMCTCMGSGDGLHWIASKVERDPGSALMSTHWSRNGIRWKAERDRMETRMGSPWCLNGIPLIL